MINKTKLKKAAFISLSVFLILLGIALSVCPFIPKTPIWLAALAFACAGSDKLKGLILGHKWYRQHAVKLISKSRLATNVVTGLLGNEAMQGEAI